MACLLLASLLVILLVTSCTREGSGQIPIGEQELPDMEMQDAWYTLSQDSDSPLVMHASQITIYRTDRDTMLENVRFTQGAELSGSCEHASVSSDNKHAKLTGKVQIHKEDAENSVTIVTEDIIWDGNANTFSCEGEVLVTYGDGAQIRASGFSAAFDENLYEFGSILEGTLVQ
ncbi:MAG: LPS export ABC transporter periplasmic protein LptC [Spirochaetales bacterium]|nr:LPS export ABC transporter periplasmic protein LptC [Spirochaetales bacterium]